MGCATDSVTITGGSSELANPLLSREGKDRDNLKEILYDSGTAPKPPINKEFLRLYGFTLCPFTEKARCALSAK